jgi:hypothetical protein
MAPALQILLTEPGDSIAIDITFTGEHGAAHTSKIFAEVIEQERQRLLGVEVVGPAGPAPRLRLMNVDEPSIVAAIGRNFATFGGGRDSHVDPTANAIKDRPLAFAAMVDVADVVRFVLDQAGVLRA